MSILDERNDLNILNMSVFVDLEQVWSKYVYIYISIYIKLLQNEELTGPKPQKFHLVPLVLRLILSKTKSTQF